MALARCQSCGIPQGLKQNYRHPHGVISPPRILCGAPTCTSWAMIWLTDEEEQRYAEGIRVFRVSNRGTEVELGESPWPAQRKTSASTSRQ